MENIKKNMAQEATTKMGNKSVLSGLRVRAITAKLRDAVIISLNEEGGEMARFKNIELPEALRDLPVEDYQFTKTIEGRLEFELYFKEGVLPKQMPEARQKATRADKAAAKAEGTAKVEEPTKEAPKVAETPKAPAAEAKKPEEPAIAKEAPKAKPEPQKPAMPPTMAPKTPVMAAKTPGTALMGDKPKDGIKK